MTDYYSDNSNEQEFERGVERKVEKKSELEDDYSAGVEIKDQTQAEPQYSEVTQEIKKTKDVITDLYLGGGLACLGFLGIFLYDFSFDLNFIPSALLAFFVFLLTPFIAVFDAPVYLLAIIGLGVSIILTAKYSPTKIRFPIFTLIFALWVFIGYKTLLLSMRGMFVYPMIIY